MAKTSASRLYGVTHSRKDKGVTFAYVLEYKFNDKYDFTITERIFKNIFGLVKVNSVDINNRPYLIVEGILSENSHSACLKQLHRHGWDVAGDDKESLETLISVFAAASKVI